MAKKEWRRGEPIEEIFQAQLRAIVRERGADGAAKIFGLAESSIARAALGLGVRQGTAHWLKKKLSELSTEKAA